MKQGAILTSGLTDWQIVQQTGGFGDVKVAGWFFVAGLSTDIPMTVLARVVREDDAETVVGWTECAVDGLNFYVRLRVPAGGLYRLETMLQYPGANGLSVTRGDMAHHFGVGDIFLIAGQSNAAGRFKEPVADPPELGVHLLRPGGVWDLASHPLHETTRAVLAPGMESNNPGHSPYLRFAKRLRAVLGYPIGLVPLAKVGAGLWQWNPEEEGGLYRQMLTTVLSHGLKPRGVLWYQGCADALERKGDTYLGRFARMVAQWRADLGQPELPFLTAQLNRCALEASDALDANWGKVREAQRQAALRLPGVYMLPGTDLAIFDTVHLSGESNLILGERTAGMALGALYGRDTRWQPPAPARAKMAAPGQVALEVSQAEGGLRLPETAQEKPVFSAEDVDGLTHACACRVECGALLLTFPRPLHSPARLHGLWQMNPALPPVSAATGLPLASFYDMEIEE